MQPGGGKGGHEDGRAAEADTPPGCGLPTASAATSRSALFPRDHLLCRTVRCSCEGEICC